MPAEPTSVSTAISSNSKLPDLLLITQFIKLPRGNTYNMGKAYQACSYRLRNAGASFTIYFFLGVGEGMHVKTARENSRLFSLFPPRKMN